MSASETQEAGTLNAEAASSGQEAPEAEDRRRWQRYVDADRTDVWFSTPTAGARSGELVDIALGGVGLVTMNPAGLEVGHRIVVGIGEWMIPAKVATVIANTGASYRVGLEWVRPESAGVTAIVEQISS